MVDSSAAGVASLIHTPTWAIAFVCSILITISILVDHALHLLTKFLKTRRRKSLIQALSKVKAELMLFGFISLMLTVGEQPISKICIPKSVGETFLPCKNAMLRSDIGEEPACEKKGKISLLSRTGVNQLHILIFLLAFFHVLACVTTLGLGSAKMKRWESWEEETKSLEYQCYNDPRRFRLTQQTSFARRHLRFWSEHPILRWPVCFLRLFTGSVSKVDYMTLRHGFIMAHMSQGSKFDFQKFLRRALDEDFVVVAGISLWIWIFSVLFIFFTAHGFHNYLWLPFIPLLMVLVVGTKLQLIITKMCLESNNESVVVRGTLLVKPSDHHFWFGRPQFLLHLIHFILFQNSFQLAFFTWTWYKFGLRSCFHKETEDIVIRMAVSVLVQVLIGYVVLPLYGLVTQMGSSMKTTVFTERVADGLKRWHALAKQSLGATESKSISIRQC
ncbi:MLO-like protein 12 [Cinnamomum micranthum f. kanehirae]|uniref:MLO-like protein n=1 Tax=Cinnamomum micranthum f. kanehirae TaxID=337451 RepID=A0A443Q079_9MAGN|nr:MLO-like protein 12 [Cinnamomum micranthum f. kanehirae]